ncbi:hypothetical protein PspLS_11944 [Pyricularia sp. CBS 133598]|nr:hypothetical protein PspLS_11944 [Pyricularia sp. CBS 133598]
MPLKGGSSGWTAILSTTFLLTCLAVSQSIPMDYCATINTGTGPGNYSEWQSDGLCSNFCKSSKSGLAIVKGPLCWCSNIIPSNSVQVGTDKCKDPCPGFPDDACGGKGTWGYMRIGVNPIMGTTAGSAPASTTVEIITMDGTTNIITMVPTEAAGPSKTPSFDSGRKEGGGGLGTGAAAGIAVSVISILVAGGIIGFAFLRRKRRQNQKGQETSILGNYGADISQSTTGFATIRPTNGTWGSQHLSGHRSSMPDPRMKYATDVYGGTFINRIRESFESMQDNLDYSRPVHHPNKVLRVANPSEND